MNAQVRGAGKILVTGGAGFIGSHCCRDLLDNGYEVVVVDNLANSRGTVIERIRELGAGKLSFYQLDLCDLSALSAVFRSHNFDAIIHFAAYKAVGDSVQRPLEYYANNVVGLLTLLKAMKVSGPRHLIFSSSCSIYGDSMEPLLTEESPARPTNPYARSKWMCEQILEDLCSRQPDWAVTALRYFNPAGAHQSGRLGENPLGKPGNIVPYLARLATGMYEAVNVFGNDYPTPDGTAVRDYIHVTDVAAAHRVALEQDHLRGFHRYNLGTGVGTSVLQLITVFSVVSGSDLPYRLVGRRPGDVAQLIASPQLAQRDLGWSAKRTLTDICRDAWRFQLGNAAEDGVPTSAFRSSA